MKDYNKSIELSYLICVRHKKCLWMSNAQKLSVNGFKWKKMYLNLLTSS